MFFGRKKVRQEGVSECPGVQDDEPAIKRLLNVALLVANKALGAIQMESSRTLFCFFVLAVAFALQLSGFLRWATKQ